MQLKNKASRAPIEKLSKIYKTDSNNNILWIRVVRQVTDQHYITEEESIPINSPNIFRLSIDQYLEWQRHWRNVIKEIK